MRYAFAKFHGQFSSALDFTKVKAVIFQIVVSGFVVKVTVSLVGSKTSYS